MLNCPGAKPGVGPSRGSSVRVTVSGSSLRRRLTWERLVTIGPGGGERSAGACMAVEVEQSHSGRLQAVLHDRADALHELVAEERVLLAGFTNRPAAKREGVDRFDRVGVELPAVGREQPRDAEQLACLHGVDDHGAALWYQQLERHPSAVHQEEAVGRLALVA